MSPIRIVSLQPDALWYGNADDTTPRRIREDLDAALMQIDDPPNDVETEPCAGRRACVVAPRALLEDVGHQFGGHATSLVDYLEVDGHRVLRIGHSQTHERVLQRVC